MFLFLCVQPPSSSSHLLAALKQHYFMTHDITTLKEFSIFPEVNLIWYSPGVNFHFSISQKSQNKPNKSQQFGFLFLKFMYFKQCLLNDSHLLSTPTSCPFLSPLSCLCSLGFPTPPSSVYRVQSDLAFS